MGENTIKLNKNEIKFLDYILKNGNSSDAKICEDTGLSRSSCSRIRKKLEKNLISEYTPIIELHKVGINVFLVLTFKWKAFNNSTFTKKAFSEFNADPNVIFLANGNGSNSSTVMFIAFDSLEHYHAYLKEFIRKYEACTDNINHLLLP